MTQNDTSKRDRRIVQLLMLLTIVLALILVTTVAVAIARRADSSTGGIHPGGAVSAPADRAYNIPSPNNEESIKVGAKVPDIRLKMLSGSTLRLSELRGQSVWLNFWGSWCPPCVSEMPSLVRANSAAKSKGVKLVAIDEAEGADTARTFLEDHGYKGLRVAVDTNGSVLRQLGVNRLPTHIFIDPQGRVRFISRGPMSLSEMKEQIARSAPR